MPFPTFVNHLESLALLALTLGTMIFCSGVLVSVLYTSAVKCVLFAVFPQAQRWVGVTTAWRTHRVTVTVTLLSALSFLTTDVSHPLLSLFFGVRDFLEQCHHYHHHHHHHHHE